MDLLLLAALLVLLLAWWLAAEPRRTTIALSAAAAAAIIGALAALDDRWQAFAGLAVAATTLLVLLIRRWRKRTPRRRRPWISGSLLALGTATAFLILYWYPVNELPAPTGPNPVGVRDFALSDGARSGLLAAGPDEPRRLLVRAWYPAATMEGYERRPYFTGEEAATTATGLGSLFGFPAYFTYVKHVRTHSYLNAPLVKDATDLPVVFYSHGYTSFAGQNTALMEALASHGYLVFSVQHTYDSSPVVFPDGSVAPMDPALIETMRAQTEQEPPGWLVAPTYEERRAALVANQTKALNEGDRISAISADIWREDRSFVLDALAAGEVPATVADLAATGNFSATGQMGMSFGGSATGGVCMVDARCAAAVNLDGGDFHRTPFNANVPVPFLMLYSDYRLIFEALGGKPPATPKGFNDFSYERHEVAGLREDVVRVKVNDVAHLGVSDFTLFMRRPVRGPLLGSIDAQEMIQIQNDFVLGFFDRYLRGHDTGFPDAQLAAHPGVELDDVSELRHWWLGAHPEDRTVQVMLETGLGDVELALYPERAPISVGNFLAYVDDGHYDGASFYRSVFKQDDYGIGVLQGGLLAASMAGDGSAYANPDRPFPPIDHEPTTETGIPNERGVIAWARLEPGSAGSEFFVNLSDNPVLDTGKGGPERDGAGYATFGRVLRGMRVLEAIQARPRDGATGIERLSGQILTEPVPILRAYRSEVRE